jgi:alkylation response protein AidB-like acyl-CoA dehydrogenase
MAIDFTLTAQQQTLQSDARAFAAAVLSEVRSLIDPLPRPEDRFFATQPIYAQMAKAGFVHALFPTEYGGGGLSALDFAIAAEELTRVDINVPTTLLATGLGMEPIMGFGSAEQKRHWVSEILADPENRLASFAFTEVTGGANFDCPDPAAGVQTHARLDGDQWVINGRKHFTTNGSGWDGTGAHLYTVVCRTDLTKPPAESLAVVVVPGATPGVEVVGYLDTAGHRAVASPRVHFTDVRVPAGNILGKPGDGEAICRRSFSWTAALIGAACTGVMRAAFDVAFEFAKTDKRSGTVPVIEHQNAGYMLADLKMRIEAARYLTWKACHQLDHTERRSDELAIMTKVYCSELAVQVVYDAMRLVGVNSYSDLSPLPGLIQDALCFPLYDGGNMGVRRRQLHNMFRAPDYDPMASAEAR